jgi:hypothetical protein
MLFIIIYPFACILFSHAMEDDASFRGGLHVQVSNYNAAHKQNQGQSHMTISMGA